MILAIPGSLGRSSINAAALRAAASAAARSGVVVTVDDSLRRLPHLQAVTRSAARKPVLRVDPHRSVANPQR